MPRPGTSCAPERAAPRKLTRAGRGSSTASSASCQSRAIRMIACSICRGRSVRECPASASTVISASRSRGDGRTSTGSSRPRSRRHPSAKAETPSASRATEWISDTGAQGRNQREAPAGSRSEIRTRTGPSGRLVPVSTTDCAARRLSRSAASWLASASRKPVARRNASMPTAGGAWSMSESTSMAGYLPPCFGGAPASGGFVMAAGVGSGSFGSAGSGRHGKAPSAKGWLNAASGQQGPARPASKAAPASVERSPGARPIFSLAHALRPAPARQTGSVTGEASSPCAPVRRLLHPPLLLSGPGKEPGQPPGSPHRREEPPPDGRAPAVPERSAGHPVRRRNAPDGAAGRRGEAVIKCRKALGGRTASGDRTDSLPGPASATADAATPGTMQRRLGSQSAPPIRAPP